MLRILFLQHQQRRHFKEEPGYNEIFRVFQSSGVELELRQFVYQTILTRFFHFERAKRLTNNVDEDMAAWLAANAGFEDILDQVFEIEKPDIVVNVTSWPGGSLHPALFANMRKRGHGFKVAAMHWDVDVTNNFNQMLFRLNLEHCDRIFMVDDYFAFEQMSNRSGVFANFPNVERAVWLPYVVDPQIYRRTDEPKIRDIAIFGSQEGFRIEVIRFLSEIYGPRFAHLGGYMVTDNFLSTEDYVREINQTRIIVNTQTNLQRDQIKGRIKEVLSCGGFLLEQESRNSKHFLEGSGVPLFRDIGELPGLIEHFLAASKERESIAANAQTWLLERYTPRKYVEEFLTAMGA